MKHISKYLLPAALALFLSPLTYGQSVLNVSDATTTTKLILPESCETDTKAMLEDWYLKNYAVLDYEADRHSRDDFSDEMIIERLGKMPTVIEMPFNSVVKGAIRYYASRPQLIENLLGLSLYYMPIFVEALERHKLPHELKYLPVIESALNPVAVSRAGAGGLWQFMPATASGLGLEINSLIDQRRDPYLASDAAARYLRQLYETYNDWSLAIAAYNCGPGNVNKALRRAGDGEHDFWEIYPFLPPETRGYFPTFIAANYILTYHKDHGISPALARRPLITDTVHVSRRVHFDQISEVMDIPIAEIRALNPQFRKDIIPGDIRPYSLVLPSLQAYAYVVNEDSIANHNATKYARRGTVEPASSVSSGRDAKGEYYDEESIIWHKVRKGETLAKIAHKYGVTVATIRKYNKVGKSVKAGKKLKIVTVTRRYKETAPQIEIEEPALTATADSIIPQPTDSVLVAQPDTTLTSEVAKAFSGKTEKPEAEEETPVKPAEQAVKAKPAKSEVPAKTKKTEKAAKQTAAKGKATTHKIRNGENLWKIAKRYGVTVEQIKKANNMTGDALKAGQTLTIPAK